MTDYEIVIDFKQCSVEEISSRRNVKLIFDLEKDFFQVTGPIDKTMFWSFTFQVMQAEELLVTKAYYSRREKRYYFITGPVDQPFCDACAEVWNESQMPKRQKGGQVLRNTYMNLVMERGAPIEAVARLVGHKSLASTAVHAPKVNMDDIKRAFRCHPKA